MLLSSSGVRVCRTFLVTSQRAFRSINNAIPTHIDSSGTTARAIIVTSSTAPPIGGSDILTRGMTLVRTGSTTCVTGKRCIANISPKIWRNFRAEPLSGRPPACSIPQQIDERGTKAVFLGHPLVTFPE